MIWIQLIRTKWRTSIGNLLQGEGSKYPSQLAGYPSQLFDGHAHSSPVNENEEDEFVSSLNPSSRRLHVAFHFLLYRLNVHKDLALPLAGPSAIQVSMGRAAPPQPAAGTAARREKPTLSAQVRHFKISKLVLVVDKLIVVQERLFRRLEKQASCSEWIQDSLQHLFRVLEKESDKMQNIALGLPVTTEERYQTEAAINALIDALAEILAGFQTLAQAWVDVVGSAATDLAPTEANPWPDVDTIEELLRGLPDRYTVVDYAALLQSFETDDSEWD